MRSYLILTLFFLGGPIFAATELSDHSPLGHSIGTFDDGIVLRSDPNNFYAKFRFRMQNRFTYESEDTEDLSARQVDFTVRRMRLRLDGNAFDKRLLYKIQLSFTRGDMDFDRTQYPNILRDAAVGWKLSDVTTLWYGQTKLPGNRQRIISSGAQQFVDRSLLNATLNIDRDLGFQVYHRIGTERPFWIKLAISNGEGRATENKDNGLAYTGRLEWLPLGTFKRDGDYFEGDLMREPDPKVSFGAAYSINKNSTRPGGQLGTQFRQEGLNRDLETWFADVIYKHRGFSFLSEYAKRWTSDAFFQDVVGSNVTNVTIYKGEALSAQSGYLFENNVETVARYTQLWADRETLLGDNNRKQYTVGLNRYFNGHVVKVQSDLTYDVAQNPIRASDRYSWVYRLQFEVGI